MTIKIYTRSNNNDLYRRMREFIPQHIEAVECTQFQEWWYARDYLHHILQSDADWVVNVDNDAFITDWEQVEQIISHMDKNDYHYAGMPDGGVCPHRCRSWVVMNPFFNVFHVKQMKAVISQYPEWVINSAGFNADWHDKKPDIVQGAYNHDYGEPFSSLFYFLYDKFKPLYLNAYGHNDGISTLLRGIDGVPFVYHSWYSREFSTDTQQRDRILKLYNEAKNVKK